MNREAQRKKIEGRQTLDALCHLVNADTYDEMYRLVVDLYEIASIIHDDSNRDAILQTTKGWYGSLNFWFHHGDRA